LEADLLPNLDASVYWHTIKTNYYYQKDASSVKVYAASSIVDDAVAYPGTPYGTILAPGITQKILKDMVSQGKIAYSSNTVYLVYLGA
jgi:hypothetical protein